MNSDNVRYLKSGVWRCLRDPAFWLAVGAGPVVWLWLWLGLDLPVTFGGSLSLSFLLLGIFVSPVFEEIVFRGALQGWVRTFAWTHASFAGVTLANFFTSIVFTGFHFLGHTPGWALVVMFPSLVFGWARDRYGDLTASILLHAFYNAGFFILFG